jgi:hypothetical protein
MPYFAGCGQFIPEPFDRFFVGCDLRLKEFQGDLFFGLCVLHTIDLAHAACAELFDDLLPACEKSPAGEFLDGSFKGSGLGRHIFGRDELRAAIRAEPCGIRVLRIAFRTLRCHSSP